MLRSHLWTQLIDQPIWIVRVEQAEIYYRTNSGSQLDCGFNYAFCMKLYVTQVFEVIQIFFR
ncbi:hypothetical protein NM04_06365 [Massilia aurea]|uniref:Uncharacterized protein n=1 Tax=Massilia aurea TaxID=373040 RepID=A0A422QNR2_9BURK|nr:hypothetical protein NM04_06365 [Massilia aurea]